MPNNLVLCGGDAEQLRWYVFWVCVTDRQCSNNSVASVRAARPSALPGLGVWGGVRHGVWSACRCIDVIADSRNFSLISRFIIIIGSVICIYLQVTGADIYVLYSRSWPVQTVGEQINKNKTFWTKKNLFFYQQTDSFGLNSVLLNKVILHHQNKTRNLPSFILVV